MGLDTHRGVCL